ncbi:MAG: hypothetical protein ACK55Z_21550, partial [bacterium]
MAAGDCIQHTSHEDPTSPICCSCDKRDRTLRPESEFFDHGESIKHALLIAQFKSPGTSQIPAERFSNVSSHHV